MLTSGWDNISGIFGEVLVFVGGMLNRRDEYSGLLSMENDLNEDEDEVGGFCLVINGRLGLISSTSWD